ncbi:hypothetical protein BKA56DRAFT_593146 [Ilyonectria sp. MPI-CAGE-AT-0026]|nr:hypothetical protein BKA56DRAFT_593146 [Ilyonectria sp. MPI-CAGE-AT-0026]
MSSRPSILKLPAELRNKIYQEYFTVQGGYVFNFDSQKLVAANGRPIDLALMYTCRLIAEDTKHIPITLNTITFSTANSENWVEEAAFFHNALNQLCDSEKLRLEQARRLLAPDIVSQITQKFPDFAPCMRQILSPGLPHDLITSRYDKSPTYHRRAFLYSLQLLDRQNWGYDYIEELGSLAVSPRSTIFQCIDGLSLPRVPWAFVDDDRLTRLCHRFAHRVLQPIDGLQYRYSAAAVAIRFLDSIPASIRLKIRNIVLHEDRRAIAFPESHARGLIPFCQENPLLRIERRVDLWRTIFQAEGMNTLERYRGRVSEMDAKFSTYGLCGSLADWLIEAAELPQDGMPPNSFSLVLDGDPATDLCAEIFQTLIPPHVAFDRVFETLRSQGIHPITFESNDLPVRESTFSKELRHLVNQTSNVRCNFDPVQVCDFEKILKTGNGWDVEQWRRTYNRGMPSDFDITPILPKWHDLLLENFDRRDMDLSTLRRARPGTEPSS